MPYSPPENIYWLFSSAAQAIAAFIGFLSASFFFAHDRFDKHIEKDETLEEIYVVIKTQYYERLRLLIVLTGCSIIFSLFIVFLNGYDLGCWGVFLKILAGLLNILVIILAINFVIFIINPNKVRDTVKKLIEKDIQNFKSPSESTLTRGLFLEKFIDLEKSIRYLGEQHQIESEKYKIIIPLGELIRGLYRRELISFQQRNDLLKVNKIRNLVVHGETQNIEQKIGDLVDELSSQIKSIINKI